MSNLPYAMFRNTLADLRECYEALRDSGIDYRNIGNEDEREAARELVQLAAKIAEEYGERSNA